MILKIFKSVSYNLSNIYFFKKKTLFKLKTFFKITVKQIFYFVVFKSDLRCNSCLKKKMLF